MGSSFSQISQSTQPQSKSGSMPQFPPPTPGQQSGSGKGMAAPVNQFNASEQSQDMPYAQGQQPRMGMPNNYPNTVGQWDNASIQPQQSQSRGGKGKG